MKKRILALTLAMVMCLTFIPATAVPAFAEGGYGSNGKFLAPIDAPKAGSIPIYDRAGLESISGHTDYYLANDIDLTGEPWKPIGEWLHIVNKANFGEPYWGTFDGQGHVIKGLTITNESLLTMIRESYEGTSFSDSDPKTLYLGLFARTASVKNLALEDININIEDEFDQGVTETIRSVAASIDVCGGIVGVLTHTYGNDKNITNCYVSGNIRLSRLIGQSTVLGVGGIVGEVSYRTSTIEYCYNDVSIDVYGRSVGGIAGELGFDGSTTQGFFSIRGCVNSASIINKVDDFHVGGIVGATYNGGSSIDVSDCVNNGQISGADSTGGIIGCISGSRTNIITSCNNYGIINGYAGSGGVIGRAAGSSISIEIIESANFGIIGGAYVGHGGLIGEAGRSGYVNSTLNIKQCRNEGSVGAEWATMGGLVGDANYLCIIEESYNLGAIDAKNEYGRRAGGLVGRSSNFLKIINSYSQGATHASGAVSFSGGLVAQGSGEIIIENCYTSGRIISGTPGFPCSSGILGVFEKTSTDGISAEVSIKNCAVLSNEVYAYDENDPYNARSTIIGAFDIQTYEYLDVSEGIVDRQNNIALENITGFQLIDDTGDGSGGARISVLEAKDQTTYEELGWDFGDIWKMPANGDYPILQWQDEEGGTGAPGGGGSGGKVIEKISFYGGIARKELRYMLDTPFASQFYGSTGFSEELATTAAALSAAAYDAQLLENGLKSLGFDDIYVDDDYSNTTGINSVAHQIAWREAKIDGRNCNLIGVVVRGTESWMEWASNIVGTGGVADSIANNLDKSFKDYLRDYSYKMDPNLDTVLFITGHSRGGAAASLFAAKLQQQNRYAKENVYVYTFGSPKNVNKFTDDTTGSAYANIFNIVNPRDGFTGYPSDFEFWRYGRTYALPSEEKTAGKGVYESEYKEKLKASFSELSGLNEESFNTGGYMDKLEEKGMGKATHEMDSYIAWLMIRPLNFAYEDGGGNYKLRYLRIACPVDVAIYDANGQLAGKIEGVQVDGHIAGDIIASVEDDVKYIQFPSDERYTFKLYGTDDGTMDLAVVDINMLTGDIIEQKDFSNVALFVGKQMSSQVGGDIETPDVQLYVLNDSGEAVKEVATDGTESEIRGLKSLTLSAGTLTPTFDPLTTNYTASVAYGVSNVTISAIAHAGAPVSGVGTKALAVGANDFTVGVMVGGVLKNYTIRITRAAYTGVEVPGGYPTGSTSDNASTTNTLKTDETPATPAAPESWSNLFTDVSESDWFYSDVEYAYTHGLMFGVSATEFAPTAKLTRSMLVTILYRHASVGAPHAAPSSSTPAFADVLAGQWYTDAIAWASANAIVSGVGDNKFAPDEYITREQFATVLYRFAKEQWSVGSGQWSVDGAAGDLAAFTDIDEISAWAADAVKWAVSSGLINGRTATTLAPLGTATRAEAAALLRRYIENVG